MRKVDRSNEGRTFTMRVPADWRLEQFVSASREDQTPFKLSIPGTAETCLLTVLDHCCQANPRGGPAWIERFERKGGTWQLWGEPLPHLFAPEDGPWPGWGRVAVFVRASGRTFQVDLVAPTECLATAGADLLAAAATLTTTASEWPPIPKDYGLVRAGDYRLAVHPSVTDPPQPFATAISDAQKICDRLYGRLPSPAPGEQTPVVYLHSERAQQEAVLPSLKDLTTPHSLCLSGLCIFAMSNEPRGENPPEYLVYTIGEFNTLWRWGSSLPNWVRVGERIVVGNIYQTGRDLPFVTAERLGWRDGLTLHPLPELTQEACDRDWTAFHRQAFFYVAFLRAGPSNYRAAYRAFLDDIRRSCDPPGAVKRHLGSLGYDRLRDDAARFMRTRMVLAEKK